VEVAKIWKIVRQHVKGIKGFEVTEHVVLATLSFTKYLLWKDLVDRTEELKRNPVVRHLIDTPTHTYEGGFGDFVEPTRIDASVDPSDLFAPMYADSSQIAAIVAAQRGKDFVLFGPPGARMKAEPDRANKPSNFIEALLTSVDEDGKPFSDHVIRSNLVTMLLAGEDTTAFTVAWAVHQLCDCPQWASERRGRVDPSCELP
jgi:hypothetical protein